MDIKLILKGSDTLNLTMKNLESCFEDAKRLGYEYVAVKIDMRGFKEPEIIEE